MRPTLVIRAAMLLAASACSGERVEETVDAYPSATLGDSDATEAERIDQLGDFTAAGHRAGVGCGTLSVTDGTVQLDASESALVRMPQSDVDASGALVLVAHFGSGFPGRECTDIPEERHYPSVEETWPATAVDARLTVTPSEQCSVATLELTGVSVTAPSGRTTSLGNMTITNDQWQWWPPFECHLFEPLAAHGPYLPGEAVYGGGASALFEADPVRLLKGTGIRVVGPDGAGPDQAAATDAIRYLTDMVPESLEAADLFIGFATVTDPTPYDTVSGELLIAERAVWIVRANGVLSWAMGPPDFRPEQPDLVDWVCLADAQTGEGIECLNTEPSP